MKGIRWPSQRLVGAVVLLCFVFPVCSGIIGGSARAGARASLAVRCAATSVHYNPYKGVETGLAPIPWIAASPSSLGLVGHLFYYDGLNVWTQKQLPSLHIYTNGESPDARVNMKILWELRHGSAPGLRMYGRRLDGPGSFVQRLQGGGVQFPSIVYVPTPGCWRLTLTAGKAVASVVVIAIPGKTS